jgi:hypothetical protein
MDHCYLPHRLARMDTAHHHMNQPIFKGVVPTRQRMVPPRQLTGIQAASHQGMARVPPQKLPMEEQVEHLHTDLVVLHLHMEVQVVRQQHPPLTALVVLEEHRAGLEEKEVHHMDPMLPHYMVEPQGIQDMIALRAEVSAPQRLALKQAVLVVPHPAQVTAAARCMVVNFRVLILQLFLSNYLTGFIVKKVESLILSKLMYI